MLTYAGLCWALTGSLVSHGIAAGLAAAACTDVLDIDMEGSYVHVDRH